MSLADLRKQLKELRKSAMPTPVSRMKKTDVAREIERLTGIHKKEEKMTETSHAVEEKAVKKTLKKEKVPEPVVKEVAKVQKTAHKKEEKTEKKMHKEEEKKSEEPMKPSKYIKGSQEAKDHMAKIRALRKEKA